MDITVKEQISRKQRKRFAFIFAATYTAMQVVLCRVKDP
jgi:hypothetical protein